MQKQISKLLVVILVILITVSCGGAAPTEDPSIVMTSAVSTMVAQFFQTQTAMVTPVTDTPTPTQTYTAFPTLTPFSLTIPLASATYIFYTATRGSLTPGSPTPTGTLATATINAGLLAVGCNNLYFIRDVSIPAGTVMQKNQDFTKTWKVQNNGTCDWLYQYSIVLLSGDSYGGDSTKIQKLVKVNNWTELSVSMTAPNKPGTYKSYWRLSNGQSMFGATLAVSFVVSEPPAPTSAPTITNTSAPVPTNTDTFTPAPPATQTVTPQ